MDSNDAGSDGQCVGSSSGGSYTPSSHTRIVFQIMQVVTVNVYVHRVEVTHHTVAYANIVSNNAGSDGQCVCSSSGGSYTPHSSHTQVLFQIMQVATGNAYVHRVWKLHTVAIRKS